MKRPGCWPMWNTTSRRITHRTCFMCSASWSKPSPVPWPPNEFIPLSFWYDAPLISRDRDRRHDHGWFTVHRATVPPHGVPGFHEPDTRRVSATGLALRSRVPRPNGGVADGWETADG